MRSMIYALHEPNSLLDIRVLRWTPLSCYKFKPRAWLFSIHYDVRSCTSRNES